MHCPKCHAPFSYAITWKIKDPNKFHCPACGCNLTITNSKSLPVIIGLAFAGFDIFMEEAGYWKTQHSLAYFAIALPVIALLSPWVLWKCGKFKVSYLSEAEAALQPSGAVCLRPVHIWWLGVLLFLPACLLWGISAVMYLWKFKQFGSLDWHGFTHVYLPMFAAVVGLCVPLLFLRRFRNLPARPTFRAFAIFVTIMLAWGILDIRNENYQIGGHDYPSGVLQGGHSHYYHGYFTWYFLPYRWIHGYQFD
jgi:hypothetical protein